MNSINIVFFMPSRICGGAERQMAMLAVEAANTGRNVSFICEFRDVFRDFFDSDSLVQLIEWKRGACQRVSNSIVITQASYAFCIGKMLELVNCDLRLWFMHPLNLPHMYISHQTPSVIAILVRYIFTSRYRKALAKIQNRFYFQSRDTHQVVAQFYDVELQCNYTGLLVSPAGSEMQSNRKTNLNLLSISWIGRLDRATKLYVLEKIIHDISLSKHKIKLFKVIGDGVAKERLENLVDELGLNDVVEFLGNAAYEDLNKHIYECDALFAHGTSVYPGLHSNIPVVVVDFPVNREQANNMLFRLYGDDDDLTLGYLINSQKHEHESEYHFDELLSNLSDTEFKAALLKKQNQKLKTAIELGKKGCSILFDSPFAPSQNYATFKLDFLFFEIRHWFLNLKKNISCFVNPLFR